MDIEKKLALLGLSQKEAALYKAALPLATFSVTEIAVASGLKRPTCYIILDELIKRGFISIVPGAKKIRYRVEAPDVLERHIEHQRSLAQKLIPELYSLYKSGKDTPVTKFYIGQKGVRNIFEDTLKGGIKQCYHVGSTREIVEMLGDDFLRDYIQRRVKKKLKVKVVRMRDTEVLESVYAGDKQYLREIRYAPKDIYIPDTVLIYGNKVSFISTIKGNFGFVVESAELTQTMLGLFEALWRISAEK